MVDRSVTRTAERRPAAPPRSRLPWWAVVLLVFAASRVVTTLLFVWVRSQATAQSRAGADPSLLGLATAWDGAWYWFIAVNGYPAVLPVDGTGAVTTNQWAFLPVYPYVAKALTLGLLDWRVVAVAVSVVAGAAAAVLLGALLLPRIGRSAALFATAVFSFSPLSFVLQMAYAEALGLALLLAALVLIDRRRYLAAIAPTVVLAFTRPGALVLALTVALVLAVRLVRARRGGPAVPVAELVAGALLAAAATVSGFAWSAIAALATGRPDAYFATEGAWRALWMPHSDIVLFQPWFFAADFWMGRAFGADAAPVLGPVLLVLVVGAFAALLVSRPARRLGLVAVLWCASYGLYLLAVFFPQSSVFRVLMPMAPLAGVLTPRGRAARTAVLGGAVALQALWLWVVLGPLQTYWTVL
ncbi:hypothetical protein [Amnibacterium endophyticum]|uniref:Integral membrane protein n=1 Tax=Amnibacterium endophyticum TaxID=2109337 RepID=A0ABW4LAR6_9MICO